MLEDLRTHPLVVVASLIVLAGSVAGGIVAADLGTQKPIDVPVIIGQVGLLLSYLCFGIGQRTGHRSLGWSPERFFPWAMLMSVSAGLGLASEILRQTWSSGIAAAFYVLPMCTLAMLGFCFWERQRLTR